MPDQPQQQAVGLQQIATGTIGRSQLNIDFPSQAVIRKLIAGNGTILLISTGIDSGTGDVTIGIATGTITEYIEDVIGSSLESQNNTIDINFDDMSGRTNLDVNESAIEQIALGVSIPLDGWIEESNAWIRTGNHTLIMSGDQTSIYGKGVKIMYIDSGGVFEYGVVGSSGFTSGSTTTVNLIPNTDYTLAGTITSRFYSPIQNPEGFPHWFNWNANPQGFSTVPTSATYKWTVLGNLFNFEYIEGGNGVSNATTFTASLPIAPAVSAAFPLGTTVDNGALTTTPGRVSLAAGVLTMTFRRDSANAAWTAGATGKRAVVSGFFEF